MPATPTLRVALECGRTWTFATAIDWPGWCRRTKSGKSGPGSTRYGINRTAWHVLDHAWEIEDKQP
jgi:hypothetical protein